MHKHNPPLLQISSSMHVKNVEKVQMRISILELSNGVLGWKAERVRTSVCASPQATDIGYKLYMLMHNMGAQNDNVEA